MDRCSLERCLCQDHQMPVTEAVYGERPRSKRKDPRPQRHSRVVDVLDGDTRAALIARLPRRMRMRWGQA